MSIAVRGFPLRTRTDEDVFDRATHNDPVAFAEVYRRYRSRIYGFCLSLLLSPTAAEDATQEVFLRLVSTPPGHVDHPRAWLFGIARNVCTDALRKRLGGAAEEPLDQEPATETAVIVDDSLEETLARETARNVFLALRRLNPRYRTALILRDMHGESSASIAAVMGTTPGAVDTLASRARDSFGRAYAVVSDMPSGCRDAVTLAYKASGTGISAEERARLEAHLADCPSCRRESERATDTRGLSALVPLLASLRGRRVFAEAAGVLQCAPAQLAEGAPALAAALPRAAEGIVAACVAGALLLTSGAVRSHVTPPAPQAVVWHASGGPAAWADVPCVARRASEQLGTIEEATRRERRRTTARGATTTRASGDAGTRGTASGGTRAGSGSYAGTGGGPSQPASGSGTGAGAGTGAGTGPGSGSGVAAGPANGGIGDPADAGGASGGSPAAGPPSAPAPGSGTTAPGSGTDAGAGGSASGTIGGHS